MTQRFLSLCGVIAPLLFAFTAILGGALGPGYSHMSDTVSELFSPGAPNKLALDTLHTTFAVLLVLFGIGLLRFVRRCERPALVGTIGALLVIAMGMVSVATATLFPQDAWGSPPTFAGEMHKNLSGLIGLLSLLSMLLLALWFRRAKLLPGFATYTYITIGVVLLSAGFYAAEMGSPVMGLAERVTILAGFQWTFVLAVWMSAR